MFKQAYVRGVQTALLQDGRVSFPDQDTAVKVADYVAAHLAFEPQEKVSRETTAKVAEALIDSARYLANQPGYKAASFNKLASVEDLSGLAHAHVVDLMEKAAEGSNYTGGDKGNTEATTAEGKDLDKRPDNYARLAPGQESAIQSLITDKAVVGREVDIRDSVPRAAEGTNSLYDHTEKASSVNSLAALMKKVAEGSNYTGGDKGNKDSNSAEGDLDKERKNDTYARQDQGDQSAIQSLINDKAVVGREVDIRDSVARPATGENSLTEHSDKAASADPYVVLFKKTAQEIVQYIPGGLNEQAKVAHVRACMGMTTEEKASYLVGLQKEAADRTAPRASQDGPYAHYNGKEANQKKVAELPDFIKEKMEAKKDGDGDGKKDEGDDKKNPFATKSDKDGDGEKKEGSLAEHFRRIAGAIQTR